MVETYDAVLIVGFGGPDGPDDVMPFLENVTRGKNVPRERLEKAAARYEMFDGVSPINAQMQSLLWGLINELNHHGPSLPVYWGNLHWHPMLEDVVGQMTRDGIGRALALATSAFGSYPGCRQYCEAIERARVAVGPEAPEIDKLRLFFNHPGFIEATADRCREMFDLIEQPERDRARLVFSAHSLPEAMAATSPYLEQLREACRLVAEQLGREKWDLVFQSRSGPPTVPWLEPDVNDYLHGLGDREDANDVVLMPVGFLSDHAEIVYDLDVEAAQTAEEVGIRLHRASTVGVHPRFIRMICQLIRERTDGETPEAIGCLGPSPDRCPDDCCPPPRG